MRNISPLVGKLDFFEAGIAVEHLFEAPRTQISRAQVTGDICAGGRTGFAGELAVRRSIDLDITNGPFL